MKRLLILLAIPTLCLLALPTVVQALITDPEYHTVAEIKAELDSLQSVHPDILKVVEVGRSQQEGIPFYAALVSNDVTREVSERPAVIFYGQVHAEEVLGVEYCLALLRKAVSNTGNASRWRSRVDLWVVPTSNPEGLNAVHEFDYTYRKNKRDNIGDGLFRWWPGWGNDTSGVDINRNFPFFWTNGDHFLTPGRNEPYDYYRGPAPLSESESRAMDAFQDSLRPAFSIVIHSSRTGNFAEKVIYPWDFGFEEQTKKSPDIDMLGFTANNVANRCRAVSGGNYQPSFMATPNGNSDAWFYWRYGTLAYRIEIGQEADGMQPDSAGIRRVIDGVSLGMEYYINSLAGISRDEKGAIPTTRLFIKTTDAATGEPMETRLVLPKRSTPLIPYRTTSRHTGVIHWVVNDDFNDTLTVTRFGYITQTMPIYAEPAPRRPLPIEMERLPLRTVHLNVSDDNGVPIDGPLSLQVEHIWAPTTFGWGRFAQPAEPRRFPYWMPPDTAWTAEPSGGSLELTLPDGGYRFTLTAGERFVPRVLEYECSAIDTLNLVLSPATVLLKADFDGADVIYTSDNVKNLFGADSLQRWSLTDYVIHTPPRSLTDSRRGNTLVNEDTWCAPYDLTGRSFDLSTARTAALVYYLNQALEPGHDSMWVEVATDADPNIPPSQWTWTQTAPAHQELSLLENVPEPPWNAGRIDYQRYAPWKRFVIPLDDFCGDTTVAFRFRLKTDNSVTQDGVYIDDVLLLASDVEPPLPSSLPVLPLRFTVRQPHPNPFNSRTEVRYSLPEAGSVGGAIYDTGGRLVRDLGVAEQPAGAGRLTLDGAALPAGLYILVLEHRGERVARKLMLLK